MKRNEEYYGHFCTSCGKKLDGKNSYLNMLICKKCFIDMIDIDSPDSFYQALRLVDEPFVYELWFSCRQNNTTKESIISNYMRNINLLQYKRDNLKDDNKTFIEQRVENLKKEAEILDKKIANANMQENFGTYKNLIQAYTEILRLIERYDWQLQYSEYTVGCDTNDGQSFSGKQVSVWEQNSEGNIRNHKIWNVKDNLKEDVYIDTYGTSSGTYNFSVYHNDEVYYINSGKYSYGEVVDQLINILKLKDKNVFIDTNGIGLGIADALEARNIKYNKMNVHKF